MPAGAGASAPASALPLQTVQQHTFNVARTARAHVRLPRRALIGFASHRLPPPQPHSSWNSSTQAVVASTSFVPKQHCARCLGLLFRDFWLLLSGSYLPKSTLLHSIQCYCNGF